MINIKQELQNYPPIDLNAIAEDILKIPDNIKNSVVLYNKALENLRMNSEDIAIIELKKAISMNPNFHEAMNLLGLCYSYTKEYSKAIDVFEKVVAAENNSVKALRYLNILRMGETPAPVPGNKKKTVEPKENIKLVSNGEKKSPSLMNNITDIKKNIKVDVFKFTAGFLIATVIFVLISLSFQLFKTNGSNLNAVQNSSNQSKPSDNSKVYEEKLNKLNEDFKKLQKDMENNNAEIDYYKNVVKLFEIEKLVTAKNYEEAADKLALLKTVSFKEPEKGKFDNLYSDAIPKAAWKVFNEGYALMQAKKYQEALNKLSKVQVYGSDWEYMDLTLYYMGNCYKEINDARNALIAFQKIKDNYPKSQYVQWADMRIKELTQIP